MAESQTPSTLSEENRARLDGIVQQMMTNGENDATIQAVVDDFKGKYSGPATPEPKSLSGFMSNIVKSGVAQAEGIGHVIAHPIDTASAIRDLGVGAYAKGFAPDNPTFAKERGMVDAVGDLYKKRYGGGQQILDTLYNDPVGSAFDASALLGGGGAALEAAGTAGKMSTLADVGRALSATGEVINPARAVTVPAKALLKETALAPIMLRTRASGTTLEDFETSNRAIAKTIRDEGMITRGQADRVVGVKSGDTAAAIAEGKAAGAAPADARRLSAQVRQDVTPMIERRVKLGEPDEMPGVRDNLRALRDANKGTGYQIPVDELNGLKQEAQTLAYESGVDNNSVKKALAKAKATRIRQWIEQEVPETADLNRQTQAAMAAREAIKQSAGRGFEGLLLGGGAAGAGGVAGLFHGDPLHALASVAAGSVAASPTAMRGLGVGAGRVAGAIDPGLARAFLLAHLAQDAEGGLPPPTP